MNKLLRTALFSGLLVVATGCPTAPGPDPLPAAPKVVKFTATPASVRPGDKVSLAWEVTDATAVSITDVKRGAVSGVDDKLSGTVMVTPDANALYVLAATNARGVKTTALASVTVEGTDTTKVVFAALPATITGDEGATLVWSAPGAHAVTITPAGGQALDLAGQVAAGTVVVKPTASETTYALAVDGAAAKSITVTRAPTITTFTASKKLLLPGASVDLAWKTSNATKVTLAAISRGTLTETTDAAKVADGTYTDTVPTLPNGANLDWVLTVTGPGGSVSQNLSSLVGADPVLKTVTAPVYAKTGSKFTVSWTTANTDVVQVRQGATVLYVTPTAALAASGSLDLPAPATEQTWTVAARAEPSGVEVTKDFTVKPVGPVTITTFNVTPGTVADGGEPVTITWNVPNARNLRVLQDGELTVAAGTGATAETGTQTAYVNRLASSFVLTADNTLDPAVTGDAGVAVASVAEMALADGGLLFENAGPIDIGTPIGTQVFGLPHGDVVTTMASTTFDDIAATGKKVDLATEDSVASVTIPNWETFLYGSRFAGAITVSSNGWASFTSTTSALPTVPTTFPGSTSLSNLYAPLWTDLEFTPGAADSAVYWQVKGNAPDQTLIIQWNKLRVKGAATSVVTMQVRVAQVGTVTFDYKAVTNLPATPTFVAGVQGVGTVGLTATPVEGASVQFFGPKTTPIAWLSTKLPVSGWAKVGNGYARISLTKFIRATDIAISEVMYAPVSGVVDGEWFEVRNGSSVAIDLGGWTIDFGGGNTHTIAGSFVLPPRGVRVLGQSADPARNDGVTVNYAYGGTFQMPDTGGSISLLNGGGVTISATWTATGPGAVGVSGVFDPAPVLTATGPAPQNCAATATYGSATPTLQRGTPGVLSGCLFSLSVIPVSFLDISTTGTLMSFSSTDDGTTAIDISSAPITLRGVTVSGLSACTNGWLVAGATTSTAYTNKTLPSTATPTGTLAPFWDDLSISTGAVYYRRIAAAADPNNPAPHWIVQWKASHLSAGDDLNFQVKLFDSGIIEYHYGTMTSGSTSNYANGNSATIWAENEAGTAAVPFSVNQANVTPNMALRFAP
jgi:hypothetical protein